MRELIKNATFYEKKLIFISIYVTLTFCCTKFEVHYLCRAAKLIWSDTALFVALLYILEPYFIFLYIYLPIIYILLYFYNIIWKVGAHLLPDEKQLKNKEFLSFQHKGKATTAT